LVLVGILLTCYRTQAVRDNVVAIIAGVAAIGIGLFPMEPDFAPEIIQRYPHILETCYMNIGILGYHVFFVGAFFSLSFYLVYFRFSALTPVSPTSQKLQRNRVYKICGAAMLVAFVAIGVLALKNKGGSIFWPETVAVVAFGVAWLVKGQTVLKDPAT